jgi:hypothetical protein
VSKSAIRPLPTISPASLMSDAALQHTHGTVMAVHSVTDPGQMGHLWGDVTALYLTAAVLAVLVRRELPGVSLIGRGVASGAPNAPSAGARA